MNIAELKNIIKRIVQLLVNSNFDKVHEDDFLKEISAQHLREIFNEYDCTLTFPPENAFDKMIIYVISDIELTVDFDLWCKDEKSDITLTSRFKIVDGTIRYSIENIHVF